MRTFIISLVAALMLLASSTYAADSPSSSQQSFTVVVDYSQSLVEMIQAGKYDYVDSAITADHFPSQGKGQREVEIVLFHFNRSISSEQAIMAMDSVGFRPVKPPELFALGVAQPDLQRQFPIIALGQLWVHPDGYRLAIALHRRAGSGGDRRVIVASLDTTGRRLDLIWLEYDWRVPWRFAAVRK